MKPSLNLRQLRQACERTLARLGRRAHFPLVENMAYRLEVLITAEEPLPFTDALRQVLNEFRLRDAERELYREILGSYFGKRGAAKAAANRKGGKPRKEKPKDPEPEYDEKTHQWNFHF